MARVVGPRGNNSKRGMDQQGPVRGMRGMWVIDYCHTYYVHAFTRTNASREGVCRKEDYLRRRKVLCNVESKIWYDKKKKKKKDGSRIKLEIGCWEGSQNDAGLFHVFLKQTYAHTLGRE